MTGIEFALACVGGVLGAMLERYAYRAIRRAVARKRRRPGIGVVSGPGSQPCSTRAHPR